MTKQAIKELKFPGKLRRGSKGEGVRRLQEWLCLNDHHVAIDGRFGPATEAAVVSFSKFDGVLSDHTWHELVRGMRAVTTSFSKFCSSINGYTVHFAQQHVKHSPREVGGENRGPWVRLYMNGIEGQPWCAGFVRFVVEQAAERMEQAPPFKISTSCDRIAKVAKEAGRFQHGRGKEHPFPGDIFLKRKTANDWVHTGIVTGVYDEYFTSIEGNTNDEGSREGYKVCERLRGYKDMDFVII